MFLISLLMVIISSYFMLSVIYKKLPEKNFAGFLYFLIIAFAQLVLSFEVLSLFKAISNNGILICNAVFLIISVILFVKNGKIIYKPDMKKDLKQIIFSLKRDKLLLFLSVCFFIFLIFQIIMAAFYPIVFGDAVAYYLPRCTSWIQYGSINHFSTPDTRELVMPVNMEFLYTWALLLRRNEIGISLFSFMGYLGAIYVLFNFLKELGYSVRKRLWSIFVFSSFVLIMIEMYSAVADLFIGALMLASMYLYIKALKSNNIWILYFSSLSYALAVGTKTTALISIPPAFVAMLAITYLYKKESMLKQILTFSGFFIINLFIFASYSYILNIIHFSNPISCSEQMLLNKFRGGFKGWLCNLIKYSFAIFDASGIRDYIKYNEIITYLQISTLKLLGATSSSYTSPYFPGRFTIDTHMEFMRSGLGVMGFLAFLPSMVKSVKYAFKYKLSKRKAVMAAITISFILNVFLWARVMVFTQFNLRYILTFVVIASPVLVYSYIRKNTVFKLVLCFFMFVYFIPKSFAMPTQYCISYIRYSEENAKDGIPFLHENTDIIELYRYVRKVNAKKVGLIIDQSQRPSFYLEKAKLFGVKMDKILVENIEAYRLEDYDYIITDRDVTATTNIILFEDQMKYPDLFVTTCEYYDYDKNLITDINTKPVMVKCYIPYEYLKRKGFVLDNGIQLEDFTVLKNVNKNL